jgi:hypothetical protein
MTTKYFTHFVTGAEEAPQANEWSGVVELNEPLEGRQSGQRELRKLLAASFDVDTDDIRILHWARLH